MGNRIHVCIVTSAHSVGDVRVQHKIAESFLREGFRVTWVGPDLQYVAGKNLRISNGQMEYRLFIPPKGRVGRLFSGKLIEVAGGVEDVDVFFAVEPDSAKVANILARKRGVRSIFDIHELYDRAHVRNWSPRPLLPLASWLVRRFIAGVCSRADCVIAVGSGVLAPYLDACRDSLVVRNCAPRWFSEQVVASRDVAVDEFVVMHGKTTEYNGTQVVLKALSLVAGRTPKIRSIMYEWYDRAPIEAARSRLLSSIDHLGLKDVVDLRQPVPMREMPLVLGACSLGMIAHGRQLSVGTQPNRVYEYMACGLPILAPAYDREISQLIEAEKCGVLVDFEDPKAIADALIQLAESPNQCREMGERGRRAFLDRHNWETEFRPLLDRIEKWSGGGRGI